MVYLQIIDNIELCNLLVLVLVNSTYSMQISSELEC